MKYVEQHLLKQQWVGGWGVGGSDIKTSFFRLRLSISLFVLVHCFQWRGVFGSIYYSLATAP